MRRWFLGAVVVSPSGCETLGGSCTDLGCDSTLTFEVVDADPAGHDFQIAVTVDGLLNTCAGVFDPVDGLSCDGMEVTPTAEGYRIVVPLFEDVDVDLTIARDDGAGFDGEVVVAWGEPTYPNGESCEPQCVNGTAEVEVQLQEG